MRAALSLLPPPPQLLAAAVDLQETFGSTCHGAGRAMSRSHAVKTIDSKVLWQLCSVPCLSVGRLGLLNRAANAVCRPYLLPVLDTYRPLHSLLPRAC